jgi:hypothetical protein
MKMETEIVFKLEVLIDDFSFLKFCFVEAVYFSFVVVVVVVEETENKVY